MYEKLEKLLTPVCRLLIALVLFLAGLIWQLLSGKTLDQYPYYVMCAAALCVVHVIICKLARSEADFILYVVLNLAVLIFGFALTEMESITGVVLYSVWGICHGICLVRFKCYIFWDFIYCTDITVHICIRMRIV